MANDNALYLDKVFPDSNFLRIEYKPYEKMKDTCIFVLDTNALLSPYRASSKSFDDIKSIYTKLKDADRLRIPFRALQEYAKNRGNSLQEQYTHFDKMNRSDIMRNMETEFQVIPLLQTNQHFKKFHEITNKINELIQARAEAISAILCDIKELYWNDPIFEFYKTFITDALIAKLHEGDLTTIASEMKLRYECKVPPGFPDQSKADGGIGDLIIWKTILSLGATNNIVFVSNDQNKKDWYYVSEVNKNKTPVAPRFELLVEFSRQNPGYSIDFMDFPTFLESQKAKSETVHELAVNLLTPFNIISEDIFMQELNEAFNHFNSIGGFLSSRYFIETYLATQGYDIRASWNTYYRLKERGLFREYQYQDVNKQYPPLNAISLL